MLTLDDRDQRSFHYGSSMPIGMRVAHFGERPLDRPVLSWELARGNDILSRGNRALRAIPCGRRVNAGKLGLTLPVDGPASELDLRCMLKDGEREICRNAWRLWVFPRLQQAAVPEGIVATSPALAAAFTGIGRPFHPFIAPSGTRVFVTHRLTDDVLGFLEGGGRVLLLADGELPEAESCQYRTVPYSIGSVGNMGTSVAPHPVMDAFPHRGWCDFCWIAMLHGAYPMRLDAFRPSRIRPMIRSIGHQSSMEDKAYLFEARVGEGTLMSCSLTLAPLLHLDPAARYLLYTLLCYLANGPIDPQNTLTVEQLKNARR